MKILSIDQGTTSTRSLLVNTATNEMYLSHSVEHQQYYPKEGWVEHDGKEILHNIYQCVDKSDDDIDAIAIDNQGESCLAWDAITKEPLSPIIVWQDKRTESLINALKQQGHEDEIKRLAGLPLDAYFSASKLAWLLHNNDKVKQCYQQNRLRMGTTDAYFLDALTGNYLTDITTASRTSLMNIATGQWDERLCHLFGVPIEVLPTIMPTIADFGHLTLDNQLIPIKVNIVDQQAALYGHDCQNVGDVKITFGTGAFILANTGSQLHQSLDNGLLPTIAWQLSSGKSQTTYALDGGVYCAASAVNWAKSLGLFNHVDELADFNATTAIERDLVFVPALVGLACPHWLRSAGGSWLGLHIDTSNKDMLQALLEGVALRASEVLNLMSNYQSLGNTISIDGGLSNNQYFCQFLANINNKTVVVPQVTELTALGAAKLLAKSYGETIDVSSHDIASKAAIYQPNNDLRHVQVSFQKAVDLIKQWP